MTGPLWLTAIGLSGSLAPCGPPMTCWNQTLMSSPGLAATMADDVVPAAPQMMLGLVTSWTGLLVAGTRSAAREAWAAPLRESFCDGGVRIAFVLAQ